LVWIPPRHYKVVGGCLAAARKRAELTQQDLARKLGKPQSFVSDYERGQRRVDLLELLRIAEALGANPVVLLAEIADATSRRRARK
jgi:transcriptional regulator with XRE-family HTH domain